ncbi:putative ATPase [Sphingobium sp. JAI105]|uniref:AAA family ATPase n=1 Tax=Sphingobium sp. JAI105 TaxID=2787715 RepID=UPI0018CB27ED|nr:AAA family ATPase [Sphingobium sp. JAI105]MBG6119358.1 putative ATPase [Sphingobium sp. JAI105]
MSPTPPGNFVVISGCSGGGKSTLLAELARRGFAVVEEPGRRVIAEEQPSSGTALPWIDLAAFARRAIDLSLRDRDEASGQDGWVFFDRGLIDAAIALEHASGEPAIKAYGSAHRYHRHVFLTPPWPRIYVHDAERRHDLDAAIAEYDRLLAVYPSLGYDVTILPKVSVVDWADFLLSALNQGER